MENYVTSPESLTLLKVMLGLAGSVIFLLLTIIGFFIARIVTDVRKNTTNIGQNKGKIELVGQQQKNDTQRIEEMTQIEIRVMSKSVTELSNNVQVLVTALAKKGIDPENVKS